MLNVYVGLHIVRLRGIWDTKVQREAECCWVRAVLNPRPQTSHYGHIQPRCWGHRAAPSASARALPSPAPSGCIPRGIPEHSSNLLIPRVAVPPVSASILGGDAEMRAEGASELCPMRRRVQGLATGCG